MSTAYLPGTRIKDMTGQEFGRLVVRSYVGNNKRDLAIWRCACTGPDCKGREVDVLGAALRSGNTRSCGCLHAEQSRDTAISRTTHGQSYAPLYSVWTTMIKRCENPGDVSYPNYGGRGITVCPEWRNSFEAFQRDMGPTYAKGLSIERRDVNGHYTPDNCTWATPRQQANNKRTNRRVTFRGVTHNVTAWAELLGLNRVTLFDRLYRGWSAERALTTGANPEALARFMADTENDD